MAQLPPPEPSSTKNGDLALADDLARAIAAVAGAPERLDLWDDVERLAADTQRPDDVAALYGSVLGRPLPRDLGLELCERAVGFLGEWYEESDPIAAVLTRALEIDPTAGWAFRRLTMLFTVERRWDDLLALYDRGIEATTDPARRVELYTEAAQIAKDLAGRAERAIEYLGALGQVSTLDLATTASLERLLEREGRYRELVTLWRDGLADLDDAAARAKRAQIAALLLDRLESPAEALEAVERLLADPEGAPGAIALLERIFVFATSPAIVRARARSELCRYYAANGRGDDVVRVLRAALGLAEDADRAGLHREIAELLVQQGRDAEALDHYAELCALEPQSREAVARLRELSERAGRLDRYTVGLTRAADACPADQKTRAIELLLEAARVRGDEIGDAAGATALYWRIFQQPEVTDHPTLLEVTRRLDDLLRTGPRARERLEVLERRATLEPEAATRRSLLAEAAELAGALGDPDRALAAWGRVLSEDPADDEAHGATIAILEREGRWEPLIAALGRAAAAPGRAASQRAHRVRAARTYEERLRAVGPAVDAWREIESLFGSNEETIDALASLLDTAGRWGELGDVLERGIRDAEGTERRIALLQRLGDVARTRRADPARALDCYRQVLAEEPAHAAVQAGLRELLSEPSCRAAAVGLLLQAFAATEDWSGRLSLLEHRLEEAAGDDARSELLREAADLEELRAGDPEAALRTLARALPLAPDDVAVERRIVRLAEATGGWSVAARSFGQAVAACPPGARAAELHYQRGAILETPLSDLPSALAAYLATLALAPERLDAARAAIRVATRQGRWDVAAQTLVASARAREACDPGLLAILEEAAAGEASAWDAVADALASAVTQEPALTPAVASSLERRIAVWHRDRRKDGAAAEEALLRALGRSADGIDTLTMLADVQRGAPGRPFVDTLLRLADAGVETLASLREAATVAVDVLHDETLARTILERLFLEIKGRLRGAPAIALGSGEPGADPASFDGWGTYDGTEPAPAPAEDAALAELATFAIRELTRLATGQAAHDRAVAILVEAAELPLGAGAARERLHEAAAIAEDKLGDVDRAVELYRAILSREPGDERAIERLSALFARGDRVADMLALRQHQLGLAGSAAERIRLRLQIAALHGRGGDTAATAAALRANLEDEPGEGQSLEELAVLLMAGEKHEELAGVLEQQAMKLEARGAETRAAHLWTRASELSEEILGDLGRALAARTRAAAFAPTAATFDALARLCSARGDHAAAVAWLDRRLSALDAGSAADRIATVVRLADAHLASGRPQIAEECLGHGLREHPEAEALREPLRKLYRASASWEKLVELLTANVSPPRLDYLREAAEVCLRRLGSAKRAIPILDAIVEQAPSDRPARLALAAALRETGELDGARVLLTAVLEEYGRRRPPERAEACFQLAQVATAAGDGAEAQRQLEAAIGVAPEHPGALRMLGRLYRVAGDLGRAERV
jgi:tetratricopeptide (TPR) repeat protein